MGPSGKIKRAAAALLCLAVLTASFIWLLERWLDENQRTAPEQDMRPLVMLAGRESYTEEEYSFLLGQTGLGKPAVNTLQERYKDDATGYLEQLAAHQADFYAASVTDCRKIGFFTSEERLVDAQAHPAAGFSFADLRTGDVLITSSTHTLGWRHGHAALVINGELGVTLESVMWGQPSTNQSEEKWRRYPAVIQLRLKESQKTILYGGRERTVAEAVAAFAAEEVREVPYGLLAGIPEKAPGILRKTHCAHLVWYPYHAFGYDIDGDGGWLVTPRDLAQSELFEVVQVYGIDPERRWS